MRTKIIKWTVLLIVLMSIIFPYKLFTDGPSKELKKQYKWMTDDLYFYVDLYSSIPKNKLDKDFVFAIIDAESEGSRLATSCVGAISYMQVMPLHYPDNPNALYNPALNIKAGCWFLSYCMRLSKGDMIEALKNYNAGPASSYYNMPYIKKIMHNYMISKNIITKPKDPGLGWDALISML